MLAYHPAMRANGVLLLLAAGIASGCVIPEQDNPRDPKNSPIAVLSVNTAQGTRATSFVFDASGSSDPRERGPLEFRWEFHDAVHDTEPAGDFDHSSGEDPIQPWSFGIPAATADSNGEAIIARRVRVKVVAADGASATDEVTIVVQNRVPRVDLGEDLFVSRLRTEPIVLDAEGGGAEPTSVDPDGDVLQYDWQQISGAAVTLTPLDANHRRMSFDPPADTSRPLAFHVAAGEGLSGGVDVVRVHFGPQVWATTFSPSRLYRIYPDHANLTGFGNGAGGTIPFQEAIRGVSVEDDGTIWTVETNFGGSAIVRRADGALQELVEGVVSSMTAFRVSIDGVGAEACLSNSFGFVWVSNSALEIARAETPDEVVRRVHERPDGDCWAVTDRGIHRFAADGTLELELATAALGTNNDGFGASFVDEDGALWVSEIHGDVGITGATDTVIIRVELDGTSSVVATLPGRLITQLDRHDAGSAWLFDLWARQILVLEPQGTLRQPLPALLRPSAIVADRRDRAAWIVDSLTGDLVLLVDDGTNAYEVGRTSSLEWVADAPTWVSPALDPAAGGVVVAANGATPHLVRVPAHLRGIEHVPVLLDSSQPSGLAGDASRGAVWLPDYSPADPEVLRLGSSGRALAVVPVESGLVAGTEDGGAWIATQTLAPAPMGGVRRVSPTGEVLESHSMDEFIPIAFAYDATAGVGCIAAIDGTLATNDSRLYRFSAGTLETLTEPALGLEYPTRACVAAPSGAIWFVLGDEFCTSTALVRYLPGETTASLSLTEAFGTPLTGCPPELATDPRDGGVWYSDGGRLVRFDPDGAELEELSVSTVSLDVVPCAGETDCVEFWHAADPFEGTTVYRRDASGDELSAMGVPIGILSDLTVVP